MRRGLSDRWTNTVTALLGVKNHSSAPVALPISALRTPPAPGFPPLQLPPAKAPGCIEAALALARRDRSFPLSLKAGWIAAGVLSSSA